MLRWVVVGILLIVTLVPFYYMILLSLKPIESLLRNPDSMMVKPSELTFSTYVSVLASQANGGQGFGGFLLNSAARRPGVGARWPCWSASPARTRSPGCPSSAAARSAGCSWPPTCSRRS